ncbi:glucoamylase [Massarina eburnea CBS 473.64]|uniref:Glucoamylase n=1 Tax=Massarina eburnea CBS 473.64 TaxID=1395130 RepID=A0A6A6SJL3_9PLEO|nr:glucoamylase [Massarina eburnea CBS 473.64]
MLLQTILTALAATPLHGVVAKPLHPRQIAQPGPSNIETEYNISIQGVLDNIGGGSKASGVYTGVILASPSTQEPNYSYTWTRDAALTMKMIVEDFIHGRTSFREQIQLYVSTQAILQTVSNPSGALGSGRGLGEPKYYSNLTRFNGDWGRPQRDGPALRATALITYSRWLLNSTDTANHDEANNVWDVIQNDLIYVAQYWNQTGFDLWEEVNGSSFFASAVQHRALVEGAALGKLLGKDVSAYESQAPNMLCFLQSYWNGEYILANINTEPGFNRTGIDANSVLGVITTYDPEASCDDSTFQPCSDRSLMNLKAYIDVFRAIYTINKNATATDAVAVGRYAEDIYVDGNPWYITTLAVAEILYYAKAQWANNDIVITDRTLPFWQYVYPSAQEGTYKPGQNETDHLLAAIVDTGDSFVDKTFEYIPEGGGLAEQFSRENGAPLSARDLTWSYAAFATMRNARVAALDNGPSVQSWGAPSKLARFGTCSPGSITGTYKPAVNAGAPDTAPPCTVLITFNLNATTFYGENLYLFGNTSDLGNFSVNDALAGTAKEYTDEHPLWKFVVELPPAETVEYSYLRKEPDASVIVETVHRAFAVPGCPADGSLGDALVEDVWVAPGK